MRAVCFAGVCFSGNLGGTGSAGSTDNFEVVRCGGAGAVFGRTRPFVDFVSFEGVEQVEFLLVPAADRLGGLDAFVDATEDARDELEADRGLGGFFSIFSRISGSKKMIKSECKKKNKEST